MSDRLDFMVRNKEDLVNAVNEIGFLPFFANSIAGFSLEEHTAPEIWFTGGEGPWEWKGPVIRESGCAYGKFFGRKAAYISREWFPDFANYRRDGYDFDARFDDGLASYKDRTLYELVEKNGPLLSKELKWLGNYKKGGNTVLCGNQRFRVSERQEGLSVWVGSGPIWDSGTVYGGGLYRKGV